jgi:16S rRNA (guanine527-N7)-methyltransferase
VGIDKILGVGRLKKADMEKLKAGAEKLGIHLSQRRLQQFQIYYQELIEWNQRINLTRITGYEEVQLKHFLDSLTVALAMELPDKGMKQNVIDVGTGAGMPGIPLKIIRPDIHLTLLEATFKKTKFLEYVVERLGLDNVEIAAGRAEESAHDRKYREQFDVVLSRAVAALPALVELALPFCNVGGIFIAQKKGEIQKEIERSRPAIEVLGGAVREVRPVELEGLDDKRYLVVIDKVKLAPAKYPRRPGMPEKRPIHY